mmetsp:Transcript_5376/g.13825  ORF Transcript_5376/g.13825 Transcript_5376/m.13825 type:complete len:106 (+) Transcript_5376:203-520(+)
MATKFKSSAQLYRDCLRLIQHLAGESPKARELRRVVGAEFRRNKDETDEDKVEQLKFNAVRALSNYLLFESSVQDEQMQRKVRAWQQAQSEKLQNKSGSPPNDGA